MLTGYRTDVQDWLAAATVWLLRTLRENFSLAVLEARSAGCAVLTTDAPGNDEIVVVDDVNALTFAVGDVRAAPLPWRDCSTILDCVSGSVTEVATTSARSASTRCSPVT